MSSVEGLFRSLAYVERSVASIKIGLYRLEAKVLGLRQPLQRD